jgi:glycosyltransferase involved in cell wall biosynthesis
MAAPLTVILLVRNERARLPGALRSVRWADEILVADTGSTDGTPELAREAGARVVTLPWEGFVASRNRALGYARHDWILFLDADERVPPGLESEIRRTLEADDPAFAGWKMPRLSHFLGRAVHHGTWYPDVKLRLGRRSCGLRAHGGRVHEVLVVDGAVGRLAKALVHHPYRDISDALRKASSYARLGADDRYEKGARGSAAGLVLRPVFEFFRCFVLKAGFLDGAVGGAVAFLHASSYFLRAAFLLEIERHQAPIPARRPKETTS